MNLSGSGKCGEALELGGEAHPLCLLVVYSSTRSIKHARLGMRKGEGLSATPQAAFLSLAHSHCPTNSTGGNLQSHEVLANVGPLSRSGKTQRNLALHGSNSIQSKNFLSGV